MVGGLLREEGADRLREPLRAQLPCVSGLAGGGTRELASLRHKNERLVSLLHH